jgi:hypothetical protein
MKILLLAPIALVFTSCASTQRIDSPVGLPDAILTLPSQAVAGMSKEGRRDYLDNPPGDHDETTRRIHYYADSSDAGGDPESMFFLRLFEDADGKTIAAAHAARPFADGRGPSETDTYVYRLESGRWADITDSVLPSEVPRSSWFRFNEPGDAIPCGRYEAFSRRDGLGNAYKFGEPTGTIFWRDGRFHYKPKG